MVVGEHTSGQTNANGKRKYSSRYTGYLTPKVADLGSQCLAFLMVVLTSLDIQGRYVESQLDFRTTVTECNHTFNFRDGVEQFFSWDKMGRSSHSGITK